MSDQIEMRSSQRPIRPVAAGWSSIKQTDKESGYPASATLLPGTLCALTSLAPDMLKPTPQRHSLALRLDIVIAPLLTYVVRARRVPGGYIGRPGQSIVSQ